MMPVAVQSPKCFDLLNVIHLPAEQLFIGIFFFFLLAGRRGRNSFLARYLFIELFKRTDEKNFVAHGTTHKAQRNCRSNVEQYGEKKKSERAVSRVLSP